MLIMVLAISAGMLQVVAFIKGESFPFYEAILAIIIAPTTAITLTYALAKFVNWIFRD